MSFCVPSSYITNLVVTEGLNEVYCTKISLDQIVHGPSTIVTVQKYKDLLRWKLCTTNNNP